jgi:hypothetical protein
MPLESVMHFAVKCDEPSDWSITFSKTDKGLVQIGFHWKDKMAPTHTATVTAAELNKIAETLK